MKVIRIRTWLCPKGHVNIENRSDLVRCSTCGTWCDGGFPLVGPTMSLAPDAEASL